MEDERHDFERMMSAREEVARAYMNGDAAPLGDISAKTSRVTFFSPAGGFEEGADHVFSIQKRSAEQFAPGGGDTHLEVLQTGATTDIAYWVGLQRATATLRENNKTVPFNLRVTEIFRREGGEWKLVHRHADPWKDSPTKSEK